MEEILKRLCGSVKLERDRGALELERFITERADGAAIRDLEKSLLTFLDDDKLPWEARHGGLMGSKVLVCLEQLPDKEKHCSENFPLQLRGLALRLLEDPESRVRLAAGELMGVLCMRDGPEVFEAVKDIVLGGVRANLERQSVSETSAAEMEETNKLAEKIAGSERRGSADASQIFHDTAGWKNLETWMKCLQAMIDGCGSGFNSFIDQSLLDLIFTALNHTNRFVRETGYYVCASLVACNTPEDEATFMLTEENAIYQLGDQFASQLAIGLSDNWSQVRLASSMAARNFLKSFASDEIRKKFYPSLLPPLCLNRYYMAEGVRIYNQDTWRQITEGEGRHLVEQHIKCVVEFYIKQTEADNHAVREAACACIAELGLKIEKDAVRPYVPMLLDALLVCFKDESWPVRDASCVACGNFILCFPDESKASMDELYPLFFENLQDNISSVRQGAALALANVVRAYDEEAQNRVVTKVQEGLEGLEKQPANAERYSQMDKGPATYGVVKKLRDNDMDLHTDKQMYSCGSLAPKMHRGKRDGGCMDHKFRKPSEPWELADGCVHLLSELSQIANMGTIVAKYLPTLAKAAGMRHYTQHVNLLETICKQLPNIGKGIGKRAFKNYLEMFFDSIFYSLSCDSALASSAASQCLNQLSSFLGPSILRGRVEQYNPTYLSQLEANQFIAPL